MVELRYLGSPHFLRLQYRVLVPTWQASGAWGEPSEWSDWQDVPVVQAEDSGSHYCEACAATVPGTEEEHMKKVHGKAGGGRGGQSDCAQAASAMLAALKAARDEIHNPGAWLSQVRNEGIDDYIARAIKQAREAGL